jgi:uncharacterized protein (DUF305 family)
MCWNKTDALLSRKSNASIRPTAVHKRLTNMKKSDIKITQEMIAAGSQALRVAGIGLLDAEDWEVQQIALEVYQAMACSSTVEQAPLSD